MHVIHGHFFVFILEETWESLRYFHHYIHLYLPVDSGNILSFLLPLFQEGQLSVTGESMCTKYWLTA